MSERPNFSLQSCHEIQERLKKAERETRAALERTGGDHPLAGPVEELLGIHREVRSMLTASLSEEPGKSGEDPEIENAALEIEREEHIMKADPKDILKALFMWRDDPAHRVKDGSA